MYPSLLLPGPPCSLSLLLATLLDVFLGHVDKVYFVKQVRNGSLPARFAETQSLYPNPLAAAVYKSRIYAPITKKSNSPRDQLKCQHIGGGNFYRLDLKVLVPSCP
jgi:hypothetical protein